MNNQCDTELGQGPRNQATIHFVNDHTNIKTFTVRAGGTHGNTHFVIKNALQCLVGMTDIKILAISGDTHPNM